MKSIPAARRRPAASSRQQAETSPRIRLRQLTHSSRRHLLPDPLPVAPAEAYQLGFCQPQPEPLRLQPDELVYRVECAAFGERAEMVLHLGRDRDGVWRILAF